MHQIPPSSGEPGGASLILGPPWYIGLRKGPHIIDSLKSKNFSNFFLKDGKKSENFQSWFWKFSTTSSDHHAAEFLKNIFDDSWKILEKILKKSWKILEKSFKMIRIYENVFNFLTKTQTAKLQTGQIGQTSIMCRFP